MEQETKVEVADAMATVAENLIKPKEKETTKEKFMRLIGALLFEKKENKWTISVGRISWWLTFSPALYIWVDGMGKPGIESLDITEHHLTVLLLLAGYNFGKRVVDAVANKAAAKPQGGDGPG